MLPKLRTAGWRVVNARAGQDALAGLRNAVLKVSNVNAAETLDINALLEAATNRAKGRLLLVLDQFEEFLILGTPERKDAFAVFVESLREKPLPRVLLLVVLRSDYQVALEDLELPPLRQGENWYQVGRFTLSAASRFMEASGLQLQSGALDHLLASAADMDDTPGLIRPITLNVVGHVLAEGRTSAPSLDAGRLVGQYVQHAIEQPAIRNLAPSVLETLVTEQGTKHPQRPENDIASSSGLRLAEVRAVMNGLSVASLARSLNASDDSVVWELSHDFVARAVVRYLSRRQRPSLSFIAPYAAPMLLSSMLLLIGGTVAWRTAREQADRALQPLTNMKIGYALELSRENASVSEFIKQSMPSIVSSVKASCGKRNRMGSFCAAQKDLVAFYGDVPMSNHAGIPPLTNTPSSIRMGETFVSRDLKPLLDSTLVMIDLSGWNSQRDLSVLCYSNLDIDSSFTFFVNTGALVQSTGTTMKVIRNTGEITSVPDLRGAEIDLKIFDHKDAKLDAKLDCLWFEVAPGRYLDFAPSDKSSQLHGLYKFKVPHDLDPVGRDCSRYHL